MGCDMHVAQEVKIKGEWHHYGTCSPQRDYALFAFICGVRGEPDEPCLVPLRGTPGDIAFLTKFHLEHWNGDAHSITWLGKNEIERLQEFFERNYTNYSDEFGYLLDNNWGSFVRYPGDYSGIEDIRWIIWFDN